MGTKRVIWLAIAITIIIAGAIAWQISRSREPIYDGKPLSFWLAAYTPANRTETSFDEANDAVQTIGTNAIPTLLLKLQKKVSPLQVRLAYLLQKQHFIKIKMPRPQDEILEAIAGFSALGSEARSAVPALTEIYQRNLSDWSRAGVLVALGSIGRSSAPAVPVLVSSLTNDQKRLRTVVVTTLGKIHADPAVAVPALARCLSDPDISVRAAAVDALQQFGPDARMATHDLQTLLDDPDEHLKNAALWALREINPRASAGPQTNSPNAKD